MELARAIAHLILVRGQDPYSTIPRTMDSPELIDAVVDLSRMVNEYRTCPGLGAFVTTLAAAQLTAAHATAKLLSWLGPECEGVELEPHIEGLRGRPDLKLVVNGETVFIECKLAAPDLRHYFPQHLRAAEVLAQVSPKPVEVHLKFRKPLTEDDLAHLRRALGEFLVNPARFAARSQGGHAKVVDTDVLSMNVGTEVAPVDPRITVRSSGIIQEVETRTVLPATAIGLRGHALMVAGPQIDSDSIIRGHIARAVKQAPRGRPFVLCIDGSHLFGTPGDLARRLRREWGPNHNTRFSGLLLMDASFALGSPRRLELISNEHAEVPLPADFASRVDRANSRAPLRTRFTQGGQTFTIDLSKGQWVEIELTPQAR